MFKSKFHLVILITTLIYIRSAFSATDYCTLTNFSQTEDIVENCEEIIVSNLQVPPNSTLNLNLKSGTNVLFHGRTFFDFFEWNGPLLKISGDNLTVQGTTDSVLDGQGELYWDTFGGNGGITKPKFLTLSVTNSVVSDLYLKNCPKHCVSVSGDNILLDNWNIDVSEGDKNNFTGHNTDGFDISASNLIVSNSVVRNQDDCVVINVGTNILVNNVSCYGGHGLSISVGFSLTDFEKNSVKNVVFENSLVHRSPNGIHIKTHSDSGLGIIRNVTYRNIIIEDIHNFGINIQQDYVNGESTGIAGNNIPIVDLVLDNITGYMKSYNNSPTIEAQILCGEEACSNWFFKDINISGAQNKSMCNFEAVGYNC